MRGGRSWEEGRERGSVREDCCLITIGKGRGTGEGGEREESDRRKGKERRGEWGERRIIVMIRHVQVHVCHSFLIVCAVYSSVFEKYTAFNWLELIHTCSA